MSMPYEFMLVTLIISCLHPHDMHHISDNPLYLFNPKEKIVYWNNVDNKTLSFANAAISDKAKWVKREDLKDVSDTKIATTVTDGVANGM